MTEMLCNIYDWNFSQRSEFYAILELNSWNKSVKHSLLLRRATLQEASSLLEAD